MAARRSLQEMEAGLDHIRQSPQVAGSVALIVCRPATGTRRVLDHCELSPADGLVGDNWKRRGYRKAPDGTAHPGLQITLMNIRALAAIAPDPTDWPLAGDQFYVDFDLGKDNLPAGSRLRIGSAVLQISAEPHLGCRKFAGRFGESAVQFVNSGTGKQLNLRGVNATVVVPGHVKTGDAIMHLDRTREPLQASQPPAGSTPAPRSESQ